MGIISAFNNETSICEVLDTPNGNIGLYATIIGIYGNRHPSFKIELDFQLLDFKSIGSQYPLCIAGDFNISFGDNYYFANDGRDKLKEAFGELGMRNLTANIENNIDHIVMSEGLVGGMGTSVETWNLDKKLSDHIGVVVKIYKK